MQPIWTLGGGIPLYPATWWLGTPLNPADSEVKEPMRTLFQCLSLFILKLFYLAILIDIAGCAHEVQGFVRQHLVVH